MADKRLSRKQMKKKMQEDEFASTMDHVLKWANEHKIMVIGFFVAIFVLAGAYVTATSYNKTKKANSEKALAKAMEIINYQPKKGEISKYPNREEQLEAASKELKAVSEGAYTESVKQRASYFLATTYLEKNDMENCAKILDKLYSKASYPFKSLVAVKYSGILVDRGDLKKALEVLEGLTVKEMDKNLTIDYVLLLKARIYKKMSKIEEAKKMLNKIINDFKDSSYLSDAKKELEKLS